MLNSINNPGINSATSSAPKGPETPAGAALAGAQVFGDDVAEVDNASVFADSMDELSASLSERTQEKKLRERKISDPDEDLQLLRERLQAMLLSLAGEGSGGKPSEARRQEYQALLDQILKNPTLARQYVGQYTGNPTEQYLLLRDIDQQADSGELPATLDKKGLLAIREAAAEIFAEHSGRILADVNTFAATTALRDAEAPAVRTAYRDAVLAGASLSDTLSTLLKSVEGGGGEDFLRVHKSMMEALGLDMAAARPSTDKVKLQALASDLFHMATISTVVDRCGTLAKTLAGQFNQRPASATGIASDLIGVTAERWLDASRFNRLVERHGMQNPPGCAVQFLQGARAIVSTMPVQVFASPEARSGVIDALQNALDAAIDREQGDL